jgi:FKBP-type peptidyl-prolyl cis-trans isomerase FklB
MKQFYAGLAGILFMMALPVFAQDEDKPTRDNDRPMTSYSLGVQTSRTFVKDDVDIDIDMFIKGLKDGMGGKPLLVTDDQLHKLINNFQSDLRRNLKKTRSIAAGENMRKGKEFLDENKKKPNVVTLPSGLQYLVIKEGDGKKPVDADTVECNYKGTLINGTQFDANDAGTPATMKVTQLIGGMKEALKLMSVGSHWQLFVPSSLAYGPRAVGAEIGPNETLIFDLELVSIK